MEGGGIYSCVKGKSTFAFDISHDKTDIGYNLSLYSLPRFFFVFFLFDISRTFMDVARWFYLLAHCAFSLKFLATI